MTKSGFTSRTGNQFESVCMIELPGMPGGIADRKLEIAMINYEQDSAI